MNYPFLDKPKLSVRGYSAQDPNTVDPLHSVAMSFWQGIAKPADICYLLTLVWNNMDL